MKEQSTFKNEYIKELIDSGYSKEDAEEQYELELKDINKMALTFEEMDEEDEFDLE